MRMMRRLAPDPVPDDLLRTLVQAAMWAPSAGHLQGQVFIVVTDRERIARLAQLWRTVADLYEAWLGRTDPRYGVDPRAVRTWDSIHHLRDHFEDVPAVIVACYDVRAYMRQVYRRPGAMLGTLRRVGPGRAVRLLVNLPAVIGRSEAASIYPAVQNLLLAARAQGLAASLSTWHLFAESEFKAVVGIPKGVRTYALIPIGWPLGRFGPVDRRPLDEVLRHDHW
jgi:nitroreductase